MMARRHWTVKEKRLVLLHYGPLSPEPWPTARIAAAAGRTPQQVRAAAKWWGRAWRDRAAVDYRAVARHHAAGLDDGRVALMAGCSRPTVYRWRKANGLRPNAKSWGHGA